MDKPKLGLLHPGAMGSSIGAALSRRYEVVWASEGRSAESMERAKNVHLKDVKRLEEVVNHCDIIFSICPPSAATDQVKSCLTAGFKGIYVDANAVSPATASQMAELCTKAKVTYVDGGIIGPPAHKSGTTRLYLSGEKASEIAQLFKDSVVDAVALEGEVTAASSLKMAYAAWTKGSSALLLNVRALAKASGIEQALLSEWSISLPELTARSDGAASGTAPKAWRFAGEMNEIAATFAGAGLPAGFHHAAEEVYSRMTKFKDGGASSTEEVLSALLEP
ncbi:MAG: NAD(P)-dependent oxidoreductase [Trueperaceae bacterium]|nr:NAD(P)-dependent oxidoreductase [Trueperaceae bacterium]